MFSTSHLPTQVVGSSIRAPSLVVEEGARIGEQDDDQEVLEVTTYETVPQTFEAAAPQQSRTAELEDEKKEEDDEEAEEVEAMVAAAELPDDGTAPQQSQIEDIK